MDWNKILIEILAILTQSIAYKYAKHKMAYPLTLIMPAMACVVAILLTSTVYGPMGMLILSIVLLYWEALREGL